MTYSKSYGIETSSSKTLHDSVQDFTMTGNTGSTIKVKNLNGDYLYGPFTVNSNYNGGITLTIHDKAGNTINSYTTCDENGNYKSIQGSCTFYIKLSEAYATKGISNVKASMSNSGTRTETITKYGHVVYHYARGYQDVRTIGTYTIGETGNPYGISYAHNITWTSFNSTLDILNKMQMT